MSAPEVLKAMTQVVFYMAEAMVYLKTGVSKRCRRESRELPAEWRRGRRGEGGWSSLVG